MRTDAIESRRRWWLTACLLTACIALACNGVDAPLDLEPAPPTLPEPTEPDNLIAALEAIYNDDDNRASIRHQRYASLFPPADHASLSYIFFFQPVDVPPGETPSWGVDGELESHRNMFNAQDARDIYDLELDITRLEPRSIESPAPGQEGWVEIFATSVNLLLMFNPQDGLRVRGAQARFLLAPADSRWYLTEWTDMPHPRPVTGDTTIEGGSWGMIKVLYR